MDTLRWKDNKLYLLDQRILPNVVKYIECTDYMDVYDAIKTMVVRGAPAIGVAAGYGVVLGAAESCYLNKDAFAHKMDEVFNKLSSARPTAVNLSWAIERMKKLFLSLNGKDNVEIIKILENEADDIFKEDIAINKRMGSFGAQLLPEKCTVLTHCNAGALATAGWGTALGVLRSARELGRQIKVYADETRPFLQGARLTAFELVEDGFDVTLICDDMAGYVMKLGLIDAVIVGADRIASNGDTANKIGTYSLSILAKEHGIPFYVAAPYSTFDMSIKCGDEIPIEERNHDEVRKIFNQKITSDGVKIFNPAFDVTSNKNITAIITDRGIIKPPYIENIQIMK